jgi:hypothetical protein
MREYDINRKMFHKGHYEVIAKRLRTAMEPYLTTTPADTLVEVMSVRTALVELALDFAVRLQADNEDFKPDLFLNRCSPNAEIYPLSELWAERIARESD